MAEKCEDIMTKDPVCCSPDDTVDDVAQLMRDQDIGPVAVCDGEETKRLIGIVTDRDIVVKVVAEGLDPKTTRVESIMSSNLATCRIDEDAETAVERMRERQVRRIPVLDDRGRLAGIISQADVATRMRRTDETAKVVEEISTPKVRMGGA